MVLIHLSDILPLDLVRILKTHKPAPLPKTTQNSDIESKPDWDALKLQYELQNPGKKQFFCNDCQRGFSRIYELDRHMKTVHVDKVICTFCSRPLKVANRKDMQRKHLQYKCIPFIKTNQSIDRVDLVKCFVPFK